VAALALKVEADGVARVLVLTSRETRRWVIPRGWPMKGRKPCEAAAPKLWKRPVWLAVRVKSRLGLAATSTARSAFRHLQTRCLSSAGGEAAQAPARKNSMRRGGSRWNRRQISCRTGLIALLRHSRSRASASTPLRHRPEPMVSIDHAPKDGSPVRCNVTPSLSALRRASAMLSDNSA
jgi:hypothetical protein